MEAIKIHKATINHIFINKALLNIKRIIYLYDEKYVSL